MILGFPLFYQQRWMIDLQGNRLLTLEGDVITCNALPIEQPGRSEARIRMKTTDQLPPHGQKGIDVESDATSSKNPLRSGLLNSDT